MAKGKELARNTQYIIRIILLGSNSFAFAPAAQSPAILRNFLNAIFLRPLPQNVPVSLQDPHSQPPNNRTRQAPWPALVKEHLLL